MERAISIISGNNLVVSFTVSARGKMWIGDNIGIKPAIIFTISVNSTMLTFHKATPFYV
jgi:hypothetical protein